MENEEMLMVKRMQLLPLLAFIHNSFSKFHVKSSGMHYTLNVIHWMNVETMWIVNTNSKCQNEQWASKHFLPQKRKHKKMLNSFPSYNLKSCWSAFVLVLDFLSTFRQKYVSFNVHCSLIITFSLWILIIS